MEIVNCPCGSLKKYSLCCEPFHLGNAKAKSAEILMRSRFSAFYLKKARYLLDTLHPDLKKTEDEKALYENFENIKWLSLIINKYSAINSTSTKASVDFSAFYLEKNKYAQHREESTFFKINGEWLYHSAKILSPIKLGRNENCFCGSLKKMKKCHPEGIDN